MGKVPTRRLTTISQMKKGETATVVSHHSAQWASRLMDLGLYPGSSVKVLARYPLGGPILLALGNAKLAVSRAAADTVVCARKEPGRSALTGQHRVHVEDDFHCPSHDRYAL